MSAAPAAVVIVDDEIDHAVIISLLLADLAPRLPVEVITDAFELLDRLTAAPRRALVLMDRMMGGREALDVLGALREARPDLTLALLSAALSDDDRRRALDAGAHHAAQKPGSIAEWRALLGGLLRLPEERRGAVA